MTSAYFFGWDYTINKQETTAWQLVNRNANFFTKRIDSNRELECSTSDLLSTVNTACRQHSNGNQCWEITASLHEEICVRMIWGVYSMFATCCICHLFPSFSHLLCFVMRISFCWTLSLIVKWGYGYLKAQLDGNFYLRTLCIWHIVWPMLLLS